MNADSIEPPRLFPTLLCRNADQMIHWLTGNLGFVEHVVYRQAGVVLHAELAFGSSILMLGQDRGEPYSKLVGNLEGRRTDSLYVAVDDPDALFMKVQAAGAVLENAISDTDYGSREFSCRDPENNLWTFGSYWPKVRSASAHN